ncbi:uncharacterized protein [Spinacia oleracea]|uniref:CCHC-type domain-containing protein n=1 Tax=Spinacia oleracea TaxID=3562 RepID=A0A9R0HWD5_SPIOL|nr:uncharacterized protein LOC110776844 [Spinacia oleracea]
MVDIAANVERVVLLREAKNVGYKRRNENQSQGGAKKPNQCYQGNQRRNDVGNKGQGYRGNQNNRTQECAKCGRRGHIESECRVRSNTCFRCGSHDHYIRDCPKQVTPTTRGPASTNNDHGRNNKNTGGSSRNPP